MIISIVADDYQFVSLTLSLISGQFISIPALLYHLLNPAGMKKILVPTDFSENALKAGLYAAEIASRNQAEISIVHMLDVDQEKIFQPFSIQEENDDTVATDCSADLQLFVKALAASFPQVTFQTDIIHARPVEGIIQYSNLHAFDFIIMGTKGATGLKELFIGSVTSGVIGKTSIPVLAVPDEYELDKPDAILFATNHFEENEKLLLPVIELAGIFNATVHIAVFIDKKASEATDYIYNSRQLEHYLAVLKKFFPATIFTKELLDGELFEETIEKYCELKAIDILSMITYKKSLAEKLFKKSMTKKMVLHSQLPILAIPAIG